MCVDDDSEMSIQSRRHIVGKYADVKAENTEIWRKKNLTTKLFASDVFRPVKSCTHKHIITLGHAANVSDGTLNLHSLRHTFPTRWRLQLL